MAMSTSPTTRSNSRRSNGSAEVKEALVSVGDGVAAVRDDVGQLAESIGHEAKARARDVTEASKEQTHRALEAARTQVRERPAATLGIAAGAGLVLGLILAGRR
jgi:ElaB/YqjD/DUF883 family membrane-anchored ribosome-binding protein